ncbi:MAG: GrdX family protein [Bacilli bacterium]
MIIITNNYRVNDAYSAKYDVEYIDVSYTAILEKVRDYIHSGYILLSHPLSGSIKPGETPFKSIMITKGTDDFNSETMISDALLIAKRMITESKVKDYTEKLLDDFSLVDYDVITSGIESHIQFGKNA